MKHFLPKLFCGATALLATASTLAADPFPSRTIKFIANTAPGGLLDAHARVIAQEMSKVLGQTIIVDNRTGADGLIGIRAVKVAPPDGYTILVSANTFAQNPALKNDIGYDVAKDFMGLGMISSYPLILITATSHSEKSMAEVIKNAKATPGKMTFSSGGVGTSTHMAGAMFLSHAGINMLHVPYKGNAAGAPDVLSGRININFDGANAVLPHVKEGRLRALGVTTAKRSSSFPDIPTLAEQGLPNYNYTAYTGLMLPAGTPKDVVQKLHQALQVALKSDAARERLRADGAEPSTMTPEEFTRFLAEDEKRIAKVATDLNLQKQ